MAGLMVRIDGGGLAAFMAKVEEGVAQLPEAKQREFWTRFEAMKAYDVDLVTMQFQDGALVPVPSEEFRQHLEAYQIKF